MFWLFFSLLTVLLVLITSWNLKSNASKISSDVSPTSFDLSLDIYREEREELARLLNNKAISKQEFKLGMDELHRRIIEEEGNSAGKRHHFSLFQERGFTFLILLSLSLLGVVIYFHLGHPSLSSYGPHNFEVYKESRMIQFLSESPNNARALIGYSRQLAKENRIDEAVSMLERAFKADKTLEKDSDLLLELALLLCISPNDADNIKAETYFVKAVKADRENAKAWKEAAVWFWNVRKYEQAAEYLENLLIFFPSKTKEHSFIKQAIEEAKSRFSTSEN